MKKIKVLLMVLLLSISFGLFTREDFSKFNEINASTLVDRELKAVWVTPLVGDVKVTTEYNVKQNMTEVLDIMDYYGMNALIFHVRTHNNALYPSDLNPQASYVDGITFNDFDPIEWIIKETHKRGIEFHAWMNPYRVGTAQQVGYLPPQNPQNDNSNLLQSGSNIILNPALSNVRNHIYETIDEFIGLYPETDAIHFDDYFYISGVGSNYTSNQKREHINILIEGIKNRLNQFNHNNNTHIQFGISPTGIYKNGDGFVDYDSNGHAITTGSETSGQQHYESYLFADTVKWAEEGWIDYLMPQVYWARNHNVASFTKVLSWWDKVFKNLDVNLYTGIGVYMAENSAQFDWYNTTTELDGQLSDIENLYHNVLGYSIYSFNRFRAGYDNVNSTLGKQARNGFSHPNRRKISVLPEIKSMNPVIPDKVTVYGNTNGTLSWSSVDNAKFYYIYGSTGTLNFSRDQIIGVVDKDTLEFNTGDYSNNYNYGVRALSGTNHLSDVSDEIEPRYTISYNLNGGSWDEVISGGYTNRDEMIVDFLTDFHTFLKDNHGYNKSLMTFMHGSGKTSGYDGEYSDYNQNLVVDDNFTISSFKNIFIRQSEYIKWLPLIKLMNEYTNTGNPSQTFYKVGSGPGGVAYARFKPFIRKENLWPGNNSIMEIVNRIPQELRASENQFEPPTSYSSSSPTIVLPTPIRDGYTFKGWYDNSYFYGSVFTNIPQGSTGNKNFYAKWQSKDPADVITISFNANYTGAINIPSVNINKGEIPSNPNNPLRAGYEFLGWYINNVKYNFDEPLTEPTTLVAKWKEIIPADIVEVINGASIRKETQNKQQGLRFYAKLNDSYKDNVHGFYVIYGTFTPNALDTLIRQGNNNLIVNGKEVFNVTVGGYDPNNMYSVVLIDIPFTGYLDKITVIPYVIYNDYIYLSEEATTRSIFDVAYAAYLNDGEFETLVNQVDDNLLKVVKTENNVEFIKTSVLTYDLEDMKTSFFSDWNTKFSTSITGNNPLEFWNSAKDGSPNVDEYENKNLSETRIYKFFNDPVYKDKWDWLLDFILSFNEPHQKRQITAIRTDGTVSEDIDNYSNKGVLFNANHLSYSLYNFFNESNSVNRFTAIDFTDSTNYNSLNDYYERPIDCSCSDYVIDGGRYKLPKITGLSGDNTPYKYFDGINYYEQETEITVTLGLTLEIIYI